MYFYTAYDLIFGVNFQLPEFSRVPPQPIDIEVRSTTCSVDPPVQSEDIDLDNIPGGIRFSWRGLGSYTVRDGNSVDIISYQKNQSWFLHAPMYGIPMAALLQQNNLLVLHGSAVEIEGEAVVILGGKGFGKSTLTAALVARGHRLLSDDVTALEIGSSGMQVLPGIPLVKLWPGDNFNKLDHENSSQIYPGATKRSYCLKNCFAKSKASLGRIFVIGTGEDFEIRRITQRNRLMLLSEYQYFAQFRKYFPQSSLQKVMSKCSQLASSVEISELIRPWGAEMLDQAVSLIEEGSG